jgi:hypothetical protein
MTQALRKYLNIKGEKRPENAAGIQAAFSEIVPTSGVLWALLVIPETSVALEARECAAASLFYLFREKLSVVLVPLPKISQDIREIVLGSGG